LSERDRYLHARRPSTRIRSKTTLVGAVVVAALLATAGIAGAVVTGNSSSQPDAQTQDAPDSNTITVTGTGQVQAQADSATVEVAVVATGDDIGSVREDLAENVSSMRSALVEQGLDESQIRTSYYDISTDRRYGGPNPEEPEYRAIHAFTIAINDTGSVGEVIDTAVTNGADEVDNVQFTLSPDRREELRQQALGAAMDSARSEATAIARAENLTVTGLDRASTTYDRAPYRVESAALAADGASTSIDSGPVAVSASVTVVYDVES